MIQTHVTSTSLLFNGKILKHLVTEMKLKENWCANCRLYSQMFLGANTCTRRHTILYYKNDRQKFTPLNLSNSWLIYCYYFILLDYHFKHLKIHINQNSVTSVRVYERFMTITKERFICIDKHSELLKSIKMIYQSQS